MAFQLLSKELFFDMHLVIVLKS